MSDLRAREGELGLILHIDNLEPLSAAVLGKTIAAISNDYRASTGRELTVVSVRRGTVTTILAEIHSNIQFANDLFDFAKNVGELSIIATIGGYALAPAKKGARSALAIFEAACASTADVDLLYANKDGEVLVAAHYSHRSRAVQTTSRKR